MGGVQWGRSIIIRQSGRSLVTNILYSQNYNKGMFDLYSALVPLYALITIVNLYFLKTAISDNTLRIQIAERGISSEGTQQQNGEQSALRKSLRFLMRNFTIVEWCAVGRGKYKLSLLLSVSIISIAAFYINSPFFLSFAGSAVYFGYFLITMAAVGRKEEQGSEGKVHRQKYLQVLYILMSVSINFILIGLLFKNYKNSQLKPFILNSAINIALDNFAVRPAVILIFGALLSRSERYMQFLQEEQRSVRMIELYQKMKGKQSLNKPIGKMYSPSKLPKCVPLHLEIEPVPMEREQSKKDHSENLSKELNPLRVPHVENLERSLDLLRRLKKEKSAPPMLTPHRSRFEDSQNSLLNSTNKDHTSPPGSKRYQHADDPERYAQRVIEHTNPLCHSEGVIQFNEEGPSVYKERKFGSDNVIMINPSRQEPVENEEDQQTNEQLLRRKTTEGSIEEQHFDFTKKATINLEDEVNNPIRINLNGSSGPSSRNQPLRICLNGEEHHFTNQYHDDDENIQSDRLRRRRDTLNPDDNTPAKNSLGVLEIKENHRCEEIEELDLNSPERRRQATRKDEETSRMQIKKKKKKLSHDERNRVIRFTTGEPYLEYLPNMLNKDGSKKKMMQAKKELVIDSRLGGKKQKRKDFNFENNENAIPSFRIEEY